MGLKDKDMTAPNAPRQLPQNPNTSAQLPPGDPKTLESFLGGKAAQERLAQVAAGFMKPVELIRLALVAVSRTPQLLQCSQASILRALIDASTLRIVPGGTMGRGFLVPRKNKNTGKTEACFDPGWRGLADIARRSGQIVSIDAMIVYKADKFRYTAGTDPVIEHEPNLDADDLGRIIAAYAVATFKDKTKQVEVLRRSDIDRIMAVSAAKTGPWDSWFDEMARKSAVRRLCKYLPYDPELERAAAMSDDVETGMSSSALDLGESESLEEQLAARDAAANPQPTNGTASPTAKEEAKALPEKTVAAAQALGLDKPQPEAEKVPAKAAVQKTETKAEKPRSDDEPGQNPGTCIVCKQSINWDNDGVPTRTPEGAKAYRHEACKPDPFGVAAANDGNKDWGMDPKPGHE